MLTKEALHERKWGRFPSLGRVLGEYPVPSHHYGFSSVSDNIFSQINRLLEIAATVQGHADVIRAVTDTEIATRLPHDLDHLAHQLQEASRLFEMHTDFVHQLRDDTHEQADRLRRDAKIKEGNA
jgi:hypothetical protein